MMRALVALLLLACAGGTPAEPAPLPGHSAFTGLQLALPARALVLCAARAELAGPGRGMAETVTAEAGADPALSIRAARASWDLAGQSVVFEGAVEVERGGFTLTCERLEARFESPERLESAEATGQVSVRHRGRVATGQRASLDVPAGRIELTGEPRIREGGRTLAGERIVLLLDAERLECERCTLQVTATPGEAP